MWKNMGEIRRPEDIVNRWRNPASDLGPQPIPQRDRRRSLDDVWQAIDRLNADMDKMKIAMRAHGILVE
jgi:hypothetical protein